MNAGAMIKKGKKLEKLRKYGEALKLYESILLEDSKNTLALTHKAISLERLGRIEEADTCYTDVLCLHPDDLYAKCGRARIMGNLGISIEALRMLKRIDRNAPGAEGAFKQKALICYDMGMPEEAIKYLWEAIRLQPRNPASFFNLGLIYEENHAITYDKKMLKLAIKAYGMAAKINPRYTDAMYKKATLLYDEKRPAEALAEYKKILRVTPGKPEIYAEMACCLGDLEDFAEAVKMCNMALSIDCKDAAVWFNMGEFYFMQDKMEDALLAHDMALKLNSNVPHGAEIRQMLVERLRFKSGLRGT